MRNLDSFSQDEENKQNDLSRNRITAKIILRSLTKYWLKIVNCSRSSFVTISITKTMISYLKGRIKFKDENFFILENNGVGYQIFVSGLFLKKIKEGQEIEVFTQLCLKQDITIELYGFQNTEEMDFFKKLNSVNGIGPKSALGILSIGGLKEIEGFIINNDLKSLTQVSGVGKKTAERLVFELKNKIKSSGQNKIKRQDNQPFKEALTGLGYKNAEIEGVLDKMPSDMESLEDRIKFALKFLRKK